MMMVFGMCDNAIEAYRMMEYAMELIAAYSDGIDIYDDDDDDWRCGT